MPGYLSTAYQWEATSVAGRWGSKVTGCTNQQFEFETGRGHGEAVSLTRNPGARHRPRPLRELRPRPLFSRGAAGPNGGDGPQRR